MIVTIKLIQNCLATYSSRAELNLNYTDNTHKIKLSKWKRLGVIFWDSFLSPFSGSKISFPKSYSIFEPYFRSTFLYSKWLVKNNINGRWCMLAYKCCFLIGIVCIIAVRIIEEKKIWVRDNALKLLLLFLSFAESAAADGAPAAAAAPWQSSKNFCNFVTQFCVMALTRWMVVSLAILFSQKKLFLGGLHRFFRIKSNIPPKCNQLRKYFINSAKLPPKLQYKMCCSHSATPFAAGSFTVL